MSPSLRQLAAAALSAARDARDARIRELVEAGETDRAIAVDVGISPATVRRTRARLGLRPVVVGRPLLWPDRIARADALGLTDAELASELGVLEATVTRRRRRGEST